MPDTPLDDELPRQAASGLRLARKASSLEDLLDSPMGRAGSPAPFGQGMSIQLPAGELASALGREGVFPVRLRLYPGVVPMGSDPHGNHTGVSPGSHRCRTGPAGGGGDRFDGCNPRGTRKIQGCIELRLPVQPTSSILGGCSARSLSMRQILAHPSTRSWGRLGPLMAGLMVDPDG